MPSPEAVLVLTSNLFFMPRIEAVAQHYGMETVQGSSSDALLEAAKSWRVSLVLVDLEMDEPVWAAALPAFKAAFSSKGETGKGETRVIAYGPHGEPDVLRKARELGSDAVLIKRDFSERLQELVETRGEAAIS